MSSNEMDLPQEINRTLLFRQFFSVWQERLSYANGTLYDYYTLELAPTAVMILATTEDGLFVLNQEYRHPTKRVLLSCPGGIIENEEDPIQAARRELLEETGYTAAEFCLMSHNFPFPGVTPQKIYYIRAFDAKKIAEPQLELTEILSTYLLDYANIKQRIIQGDNVDGLLCTALLINHLIYS